MCSELNKLHLKISEQRALKVLIGTDLKSCQLFQSLQWVGQSCKVKQMQFYVRVLCMQCKHNVEQ